MLETKNEMITFSEVKKGQWSKVKVRAKTNALESNSWVSTWTAVHCAVVSLNDKKISQLNRQYDVKSGSG